MTAQPATMLLFSDATDTELDPTTTYLALAVFLVLVGILVQLSSEEKPALSWLHRVESPKNYVPAGEKPGLRDASSALDRHMRAVMSELRYIRDENARQESKLRDISRDLCALSWNQYFAALRR